MVRVVINIDKLVLEGFDYHDHLRISRAIEQELARLVNENGPLQKAQGAAAINADTIHIRKSLDLRSVGIEIAQSVYRSIGMANEFTTVKGAGPKAESASKKQ